MSHAKPGVSPPAKPAGPMCYNGRDLKTDPPLPGHRPPDARSL